MNFRQFLRCVWSKFPKPSVEDILITLAVASIMLLFISLIEPKLVFPRYTGVRSNSRLIDRFFYFIWVILVTSAYGPILFLFLPLFFYYLAKKKFPKSKRRKAMAVCLGLLIYILIQVSISDSAKLVGSYDLNVLYEFPDREECDNVAYYYFHQNCRYARNLFPTIEKIEKEFNFKFERKCVRENACEGYEKEEIQKAFEEYGSYFRYGKMSIPLFVFKCKYFMKAGNETLLKSALCKLYDFEDKCMGIERLPIYT